MDDIKYTNYNLEISEKLLNVLKSFLYEIESEEELNDFIIHAIIDKFNACNNLTTGEVDEDGFTDGKNFTEHYLGIN